MSLMKGKKGLIMGVANERSIAWGISQKLAEAGAELAFTYLGDALKKRVVPLAEKLNSKVTFSCDVENKEQVIKLFEDIKSEWGQIDFVVHAVAFSDKSELSGEYLSNQFYFLQSLVPFSYILQLLLQMELPYHNHLMLLHNQLIQRIF